MGRRWATTLVAFGVALVVSAPARTQERPASNADELRKLDALFDFVRARNVRDYALSGPDVIDEAKYLKIGGIEQWVTIRGENRANPVVLVLHGGPGDATNPWGYAGFRPWLKTYTVVQWDQRGSGKTLGRSGKDSAAALTIGRLVQDGVELADTLRTSLRKDKIILVGHSFGSILGVLMAKKLLWRLFGLGGTGAAAGGLAGFLMRWGLGPLGLLLGSTSPLEGGPDLMRFDPKSGRYVPIPGRGGEPVQGDVDVHLPPEEGDAGVVGQRRLLRLLEQLQERPYRSLHAGDRQHRRGPPLRERDQLCPAGRQPRGRQGDLDGRTEP